MGPQPENIDTGLCKNNVAEAVGGKGEESRGTQSLAIRRGEFFNVVLGDGMCWGGFSALQNKRCFLFSPGRPAPRPSNNIETPAREILVRFATFSAASRVPLPAAATLFLQTPVLIIISL